MRSNRHHARASILLIGAVLCSTVAACDRGSDAALGSQGGSRSAATRRDTSGKYLVGYRTIQIVHESSTGERRPIDVRLWYPADAEAYAAATPSVYRSPLWGRPLIPGVYDPLAFEIASYGARDDLPLSREGERFPLIVYSTGNGADSSWAAEMLESIASHGYAVAAPTHTRNSRDDLLVFEFNEVAGASGLPCLDGLPQPCLDFNAAKTVRDRIRDIGVVIDRAESIFGDRVDSSRVAIFGWSRGSVTAMVAAGGSTTWGIKPLDDRLKGIFGWSGGVQGVISNVDFASIRVPSLLITSPADAIPMELMQHAYEAIASENKFLITLDNATHASAQSAGCREIQSAGGIALGNPRAFFEFDVLGNLDAAFDFCAYSDFTTPIDITGLAFSLTGFQVTESSVPRKLGRMDVVRITLEAAITFFDGVLRRSDEPPRFGRFLNPRYLLSKEPAVKAVQATRPPESEEEDEGT